MALITGRFIKEFKNIKMTDRGLTFQYLNHKGQLAGRFGRYNERFCTPEVKKELWKAYRKQNGLLTWTYYAILKPCLVWLVA